MSMRSALCCAVAVALVVGCVGDVPPVASNQDKPTWEEFLAATYLEPFARGVFIVNGDEAVDNEKKLLEVYHALYGSGALAVHHAGGADARWSDTQKRNLTYCVSDEFGDHKQAVIDAIAEARGGAVRPSRIRRRR